MKLLRCSGAQNEITHVKLVDAMGAGKAGLTAASDGLRIASKADVEDTSVACTGADIETPSTPIGTYHAPTADTKCRFREIDATNHPGIYEIHLPDARYFVASARTLLISVGATDVNEADIEYQLTSVDLDDPQFFTVHVTPVVSTVSTGEVRERKLVQYQFARLGPFTFSVVDQTGAPVDLAGHTVVFIAETTTAEHLWQVTAAVADNVVTVSQDDANTGTAGALRYVLRDLTQDTVLARGEFCIVAEADAE